MKTFLSFILLQLAVSPWKSVDVFDVKTSVEYSQVGGDNVAVSTYTVYILEEQIPRSFTDIESFKVVITLESGFTITRVVDKWKIEEVVLPGTSETASSIVLEIVVDGWTNWDVKIFKTEVSFKVKT